MADSGSERLLPDAVAPSGMAFSGAAPDFDIRPAGRLFQIAARFNRAGSAFAGSFGCELENGRGFLWLPVLFGIGIFLYFVLPREPSALALAGIFLATTMAAWRGRRRIGLFRLLTAFAFVAAGAATMKLRTDWVAAPKLSREMTRVVTGWVAERSMASRGGVRVALQVHAIEGVAAAGTPHFVRVTIRSRAEAIAVGDAIEVTARLQPPNGPVLPGGHDFARAAFYDHIGAVGFAYGAARPADIGPPPTGIRVHVPLAQLRDLIRNRVMAALPGEPGRIAAALIMGDQGGISEGTQEAMRTSGLGHVLSISGLHLALIAGSAFWLIRALLALSSELALRRPIKKWAALGALTIATFYLGISGAEVATQRAYIMLAIMLVAVLLDRRAITLRNVALAALVVLVISPESLMSVSLQMSFAATVALVAAYEEISARSDRRLRLADRRDPGMLGWASRSVGGLFVTSLVAGLATMPFGIFHFQRLAPLALAANMIAMPAVGLIVMPMALLAVVLLPFGLEVLPLTAMNWGVAWMIAVAEWTTAWSGDAGGVRMMPALSLLLVVGGFLWLALWRERWRLLGIAPMLAAIPLALAAPRPDILISEDGATVAVRGVDGRLSIIGGKGERFTVENWLRADADPRKADAPGLSDGVRCDPIGCIGKVGKEETAVSLVLKPDAFAEDCRVATIVVSRLQAPPWCGDTAIVIDRDKLDRRGAHALYRDPDAASRPAFRIETAYPEFPRPWMRAFSSGE
jgi:competence protein ComEC